MGFGLLFIGYFFLVNFTYFAYTDVIAGIVCLMATYKLSAYQRNFKTAAAVTALFELLCVANLSLTVIGLFFPQANFDSVLPYIYSARYVLIFAISFSVMLGIMALADEVGLPELKSSAKNKLAPLSFLIVSAAFELPFLSGLLGNIAGYAYLLLIIAYLIIIALNLVTIYRAYMHICLPEDLVPKEKKSKIGFIRKFEEYELKKSREYAEYKINRDIERSKRKKKK
jgi:hypothetical protein